MAIYVNSGVVTNEEYLYDDEMHILDGGVANDTTVDDWGHMYVSSGAWRMRL